MSHGASSSVSDPDWLAHAGSRPPAPPCRAATTYDAGSLPKDDSGRGRRPGTALGLADRRRRQCSGRSLSRNRAYTWSPSRTRRSTRRPWPCAASTTDSANCTRSGRGAIGKQMRVLAQAKQVDRREMELLDHLAQVAIEPGVGHVAAPPRHVAHHQPRSLRLDDWQGTEALSQLGLRGPGAGLVGGEEGDQAELIDVHGVGVAEEAIELRQFQGRGLGSDQRHLAPLDEGIEEHRHPHGDDEPDGGGSASRPRRRARTRRARQRERG